MKKVKITLILLALILIFTGCGTKNEVIKKGNKVELGKDISQLEEVIYPFVLIDDEGNKIEIKKPAKKIISLYSAHTENLFALGLGENIIGVGTSDIYPSEALSKKVFDYKSDPEKIIAVQPDLVIIRPFVTRHSPQVMEAIKNAGINVVSLYPDKYEGFDEYILKLGVLTGKMPKAKELLSEFHSNIDNIAKITNNIEPKMNIYFESTENEYRTVTKNSMAAIAIKNAGGINIADDVEPIKEGSSIAAYGIEKILSKSNEIDVYISQRGAMNAGGSYHSIVIRPGFENIKAVKNDRVYCLDQKIISSPTFRYYKGVREIARMLYPEVMDSLNIYMKDDLITRKEMAEVIVKYSHKEIYVPSTKYYKKEHKGHTYGFYEDVKYTDDFYDYIETAVMSGYMKGYKKEEKEYFYPDNKVTKEEFAKIIFVTGNYSGKEDNIDIKDINNCENQNIVQILVDNGVFDLDDGMFKPKEEMKCNEVIKILKSLE